MLVKCPDAECRKSHLVCAYICPKHTKIRCQEYTKNYETITKEAVPEQYIEKYGQPEYPTPLSIINRERRQLQADKQAVLDAAKKVKDDLATERLKKKQAKEEAARLKEQDKQRKAKLAKSKKNVKKVRHVAPK